MTWESWNKRSGLVSEIVDGELLILDSETNSFFRLNRTGSRIWELCDNTNAETVSEAISREFDVSAAKAMEDTRRYLEQLLESGLIVRIQPEDHI